MTEVAGTEDDVGPTPFVRRTYERESKQNSDLFDVMANGIRSTVTKIRMDTRKIDPSKYEEASEFEGKIQEMEDRVEECRNRLKKLRSLKDTAIVWQAKEKIAVDTLFEEREIKQDEAERLRNFKKDLDGIDEELSFLRKEGMKESDLSSWYTQTPPLSEMIKKNPSIALKKIKKTPTEREEEPEVHALTVPILHNEIPQGGSPQNNRREEQVERGVAVKRGRPWVGVTKTSVAVGLTLLLFFLLICIIIVLSVKLRNASIPPSPTTTPPT